MMSMDEFNGYAQLLQAGVTPEQFGGPYTEARRKAKEVQKHLEIIKRQGGLLHICSGHGCQMSPNPNKPGHIYCEMCYPDGAPL